MRLFTSLVDPDLIRCLNQGGVVVLPTDTVYGVVARASDQRAVERVYRLRGRSPNKPCIILVAGLWQIKDTAFFDPQSKALAQKYWPGPLSLVIKTTDKTPEYLHRGTHTLAYRTPDNPELCKLLAATGPLIAPSANIEGMPTAITLDHAEHYFANKVDGYVDGGELADRAPSTVATVQDGKPRILRQGALRIL
ncbi:MAG TPA: L-threonylcarbamoyladenylate synthase [Candidatus Saccharimonadales bacterium]|nr:L-threonylcarbamoyladenylate synthase [Candidatus Saccharimonadales bacterium]